MGRITDFDHYKVGDDLDIASWDSYPLDLAIGWGQMLRIKNAMPVREIRIFRLSTGDLYRTVGKGRWWVMEQQPGPVNWAPFNLIRFRGWCDF